MFFDLKLCGLHACASCQLSQTMSLSKREKASEDGIPLAKRLRSNVGDLFLSNQISAQRAQEIFQDAAYAGASSVKDLTKGLDNPSSEKLQRNVHAARNLTRKLLKGTPWPEPYVATIPVWDQKKQQQRWEAIPLLLPHEMLAAIVKHNTLDEVATKEGMAEPSRQHLLKMEEQFETTSAMGVGLWCDGAPYSFDRLLSLESIVISLPGLTGANRNLRLLTASIPKQFCVKYYTMHEIMKVIAWSFKWMAFGCHPPARHDGLPWTTADKYRKKLASSPLGYSGFLIEVRGDWAMRKEIFAFPGWRDKVGCCHLCKCTPQNCHEYDSQASWRSQPLGHWELMHRILDKGLPLNGLFACPGLTASQFYIDWLHVADLGVTQDFLGNLLYHLVATNRYLKGTSQEERVKEIFLKMQQYYAQTEVPARLDNLTLLMLRKNSTSSPKLRSKAAESRGLVLFGLQIAQELLPNASFDKTVKAAAQELVHCYDCLRRETFNQQRLQAHIQRFLCLCTALEDKEQMVWVLKPKHHAFMELSLQVGNPALTWTYRDEDVGGFLAGLAKLKGGSHNPKAVGNTVIQRWRAKCSPALKH